MRNPDTSRSRRTYTATRLLDMQSQASDDRFHFENIEDPARLRAVRVVDAHLAALPPIKTEEEPNPWAIVLDVKDQFTITLELRPADPVENTILVCSRGPLVLQGGKVQGCAKSWPLKLASNLLVGDLLDYLVSGGMSRYRLVDQCGESANTPSCREMLKDNADSTSGYLWWMDCVLSQMRWGLGDTNDVRLWLRHHWSAEGRPTSEMIRSLQWGTWICMD